MATSSKNRAEQIEECDSGSETMMMQPKTKRSRKNEGAFLYKTKYQKNWEKDYDFISPSHLSQNHAWCTVCRRDISISHQGAKDIERHSTTEMHKKAVHCLKGQMKISFFQPKDDIADKVITAEVKNAIMMAHHNTALCLADHLTPMIHSNFPDSEIAKL
nr:PREDICTED: uncharacterized protein LOC102350526 [Latimeria chalumnae]|eukprot:XP_006013536.2 PREDICTED: uncharacterized protein LOC102350526 [Latimeria chalumnae]